MLNISKKLSSNNIFSKVFLKNIRSSLVAKYFSFNEISLKLILLFKIFKLPFTFNLKFHF